MTKHVPIDDYTPAPASTPVVVDKSAPHCVACGRYHGGINVELICLRAEVRRLREKFPCEKCRGIMARHCPRCKGTGLERV